MTTVAELAEAKWGVRPSPAVARFGEPGWEFEQTIPDSCPSCSSALHLLGKPYVSGGKPFRYAAFVCTECVRSFTLQDLGHHSRQSFAKASKAAHTKPVSERATSNRHSSPQNLEVHAIAPGPARTAQWVLPAAASFETSVESALVGLGITESSGRDFKTTFGAKGSCVTSQRIAGEAGTVRLLVTEHERVSWGCISSETRLLLPTSERPALHVVWQECGAHEGEGDRMLPLPALVARASGVTRFGANPFTVGHTTLETVDRLVGMLRDPDRDVPIILISGASAAERAQLLIAQTLGTSLVATIDGDASWRLSDALGQSMGCYAGAVRIYPRLLATTSPADCPIWVSRRVAQHGWPAVSREIARTVGMMVAAPRRPPLEADLQREATSAALRDASNEIQLLRKELIEQRNAERPEPTSSTDAELDAIFDAQNETIARLEAELEQLLEQNLELESRLGDAESAREALQLALTHVRWDRETEDNPPAVAVIDDSVDAAIERLADPTGPLVCTENALRAWRASRYPEPARMLDAIRRLERAATEWRDRNAEIGSRLGDWLQGSTGLRFAGSDQGLERASLETFAFEGRKWSRIPHIKVDDGKHSNQVGRIYFALDSENRRWIVDHIGQKLYGR